MSNQAEQFTIASLGAEERREAVALGTDLRAALVKGLLHRSDSSFAITGDVRGIETQAAAAVQLIDRETFEAIRPKLAAIAADAAVVKRLTGRTIEALAKPDAITLKIAPKAMTTPAPKQSKYSRLDLNLRKIHCVDETGSGMGEWGADEMVLGAMRIGASGNVDYTKAFIAGDFDDGTVRTYGELPFGSVSMRTTPGFPKTFYWIFELVESDTDEAKTAKAVTSVLATVVKTVAAAAGQAAVGVVAGAVLEALGTLIEVFVGGDDKFAPYGVVIRLDSDGQFGSDGVRDEHTGNITGHSGTYRIGYRLRLV